MKAIVQNRFGPADELEFRDIDEPALADSDVLVRVRAAGCGPDVWHLTTGLPYLMRLMPDPRRGRARVPGRDVAGTIEAVGRDVTDFRPGDEVMGGAWGSFAELVAAKPQELVAKPQRLTFEQAAAVPVSGSTALAALRDVAGVQSGQTVLITGAGGGIGTLAVQIAKAFGATVTGVCSESKADLVRSLGADEVLDYSREDFTKKSRSWDVIIDSAGRRSLTALRRALNPKGTLAIIGGDGGNRWTGGFGRQTVRAPILSLFSHKRFRPVIGKEDQANLQGLFELIDTGMVTPVVSRTYQLVEAQEAIRELEKGHTYGKIVIIV
jgi:NADPH:quinone reductase-like Zn-dependent oxidoreductase